MSIAAERATEPRVRTTLHPLAVVGLIGAGLLLLLLVVGIGILIAILKDSRDHIRAQDAKTAVLLSNIRAATPAAQQVPPLIREARPAVRSLGSAIGPIRKAAGQTAAATEGLPTLISTTEAVARAAFPVLDDLGRVDLARVLNAGGAVADAVLYRNRLPAALDSANSLFAELRAQNLIPDAAHAARETPALIRELLRLQRITLSTQKVSLRTQLTTLDLLRQALVSIKSIDRKTGGTVPAQGPPVPAP